MLRVRVENQWPLYLAMLCFCMFSAAQAFGQESTLKLSFTKKEGLEAAENSETQTAQSEASEKKDTVAQDAASLAGLSPGEGQKTEASGVLVEHKREEDGAGAICIDAEGGASDCGFAASILHIETEFDDREKLMLLLNSHCNFPTKEDLEQTVHAPAQLLMEIMQDEAVLLTVRSRALRALGYFEDAANEEALRRSLIDFEKMPRTILSNTIRAYGTMAGERGVEILKPFLVNEEHLVRIVAITTLRDIPGEQSTQALEGRLSVETNHYFRMRLQRALDEKRAAEAGTKRSR